MPNDFHLMTATELARMIATREVSPVEVVQASLERIRQVDGQLNSFITVLDERALAGAERAQAAVLAGEPLGPLHGVPVAIKDCVQLAGVPTTYGVRSRLNAIAEETSPDVERLEQAGAIIVGTTNMPEFGHKAVTDNHLIGATSTPFDLAKNSGGSSGGSAAAVGGCIVPLAHSGDGGGSTRIPAALCGVYGLKPSFGRIPAVNRPDAFEFALPMVCQGPTARTVEDAALMLQVVAGPHPGDPLSLPAEDVDYPAAARGGLRGKRAAFCRTFGETPISPDVAAVVADAVRQLDEAGVAVDEVEIDLGASTERLLESWKRGASMGYVAAVETMRRQGVDLLAELSEEVSQSFAPYVRRGHDLTALEHRMENALRTGVFDAFQGVFADYDFILSPTLAVAGVDNVVGGETVGPTSVNGVAIDPVGGWTLCFPANFTGHPAASIPAGFTDENLPVGLQIVGRRFRDDEVLAVSGVLERAKPWYEGYRSRLAVSV